jgi:hypothetical protein
MRRVLRSTTGTSRLFQFFDLTGQSRLCNVHVLRGQRKVTRLCQANESAHLAQAGFIRKSDKWNGKYCLYDSPSYFLMAETSNR